MAIATGTVDAAQGITLSSNTLTFTKAGFYVIEGSFYVESNGSYINARAFPEFYVKMNGVKDTSSDASFYIRGAGTYLGEEGKSDHSYKITHALKVAKDDTLTLHAIAKNQTPPSGQGDISLLLNGSNSQFKIVSIEGLKGDKGDPGGVSSTQVNTQIDARVEEAALKATDCPTGVTAPCPKYSKPCFLWKGTQAEYTALTTKLDTVCYDTTN